MDLYSMEILENLANYCLFARMFPKKMGQGLSIHPKKRPPYIKLMPKRGSILFISLKVCFHLKYQPNIQEYSQFGWEW